MDGSQASVAALGKRWCEYWSTDNVKPWIALFAPRATYLDHALQINRQGYPNLEDHFHIWRRSLPDSVATFDGALPGERLANGKWRIVIRLHWKGTFKNDLPTLKATGTAVQFPLLAEMVVRDDGLIEEAAEWYCMTFWDVKPVSDYNRRGNLAWTE